jgi:hypothetical protein
MIEMPACPIIVDAEPKLVGYFTDQQPTLGGEQNRVSRLGDKWAIRVQTGAAKYAEEGMTYLARLLRGMTDTVLLAFPEPGVPVQDYGVPVVSTAGASGRLLPIGGLTPGVVIREGKFLSVVIGGQRFLYQAAATMTVPIGGAVNLPIYPTLRRQPPVGAVVELAAPKIEGFVQGNEQSWQVSRSKYLPFNFSIVERA